MYSANNATATTCNKALDHSNYWVPQLYHYTSDDTYEIVQFTGKYLFLFQTTIY